MNYHNYNTFMITDSCFSLLVLMLLSEPICLSAVKHIISDYIYIDYFHNLGCEQLWYSMKEVMKL